MEIECTLQELNFTIQVSLNAKLTEFLKHDDLLQTKMSVKRKTSARKANIV